MNLIVPVLAVAAAFSNSIRLRQQLGRVVAKDHILRARLKLAKQLKHLLRLAAMAELFRQRRESVLHRLELRLSQIGSSEHSTRHQMIVEIAFGKIGYIVPRHVGAQQLFVGQIRLGG